MVAMNAQRQYGIVTTRKAKSAEKLSSGYKINRAADDAAGLTISEKMRSQIRGLNKGIENCQDGVSICQVADGALAEVNDMLHRLTELSVKSANGTNTDADRAAIHAEVSHILEEIDRIGDTTEFNTLPVFKGKDIVQTDADGNTLTEGTIPFEDLSLADMTLGVQPLAENNADTLNLRAVISNKDSIAYGKSYSLVYGSGSTSHSSVILNYEKDGNAVSKQVMLKDFSKVSYSESNPTWEKGLRYQDSAEGIDIIISQKVNANDSGTDSKTYGMGYTITDNSTADNMKVDFVFNIDTAYDSNDLKEEYFIDGNKVTKSQKLTGAELANGISIINVTEALPFSQNLSAGNADQVIIGLYGDSLYTKDNLEGDNFDNRMNKSIVHSDKVVTLIYEDVANPSGHNGDVSFDYGIKPATSDPNLGAVPITPKKSDVAIHENDWDVWIQAGPSADNGFKLHFQEMNSTVLGIKGIDLRTANGAKSAIKTISMATDQINDFRSRIGAQTNRIEHTIKNEGNISENTQAAESRIRDTDMAKEMVNLAKENILMQANEAMMAQANQSTQGVLSLLQ